MLIKGGCWFSGDIEAGLTDGIISGLFSREVSIVKKDRQFYATIG